jgi:hypothetical protein
MTKELREIVERMVEGNWNPSYDATEIISIGEYIVDIEARTVESYGEHGEPRFDELRYSFADLLLNPDAMKAVFPVKRRCAWKKKRKDINLVPQKQCKRDTCEGCAYLEVSNKHITHSLHAATMLLNGEGIDKAVEYIHGRMR